MQVLVQDQIELIFQVFADRQSVLPDISGRLASQKIRHDLAPIYFCHLLFTSSLQLHKIKLCFGDSIVMFFRLELLDQKIVASRSSWHLTSHHQLRSGNKMTLTQQFLQKGKLFVSQIN